MDNEPMNNEQVDQGAMDHSNPYEAAFAAYLQQHGLCHVAVDETRRASWGRTSVKSLDFIVLGPSGARLLVDVKGRRFPGGTAGKPRYVWENWSTREDIAGLASWTNLFGARSLGLLVFLYQIEPAVSVPADTPDLWSWCDRRYLLRAVTLDEYRRHMRVRSPKWGTVCLPGKTFRALARPFRYYSHEHIVEDGFAHGADEDWLEPGGPELAVAAGAPGSAETGPGGR
jgi:hypothetical protein